jgi:hypothetical protein
MSTRLRGHDKLRIEDRRRIYIPKFHGGQKCRNWDVG